MKIIDLPIDEIKPYAKNPRKNDGAVDAVCNSLVEFGWQQPIVIDRDNVIIVGHTRYKAAKKLGYKTVPCIIADNLTEEQAKAYRLADNKVGELALWDDELLLDEILNINDIDMMDFGFDDLGKEETEIVEDEAPEIDEENEPIAKLGDIWQLGRHRLMCGDSTDKETVEKLMNGVKADMLLTDPPVQR